MQLYNQRHRATGRHDHTLLERLALTTLWQGLRVPSGAVVARTIQAIERREVEPLARDVADRITADDDRVAAAASVALLRSDFNAPRVATQLLRSEVAAARAIAVEGIGRKVKAAARADLAPALGDAAAEVRRAAVVAVAPMNDERDHARLRVLALSDGDHTVRAAALDALVARGHPAPAQATSRDPNVVLALAALRALQRHGSAPAIPAAPLLARAGSDNAWAVRAAGIAAAAELAGRDQAIAAAGRALGDGH
ncbi:MAG: HEAT repeat domain-containing protein, partial [Myxococcota bacterium]